MSLRRFCGFAVSSALLTVLPVGASDPPTVAEARKETIRRYETLGPGDRVRVFNRFGNVTARFGGYEQRVELVATVQRLDQGFPPLEVRTEKTDGSLAVGVAPRGEVQYPEPTRRDRVDLVIFVPLGSRLDVETVDDLITAKGLKSDVTATSRAGDIQLRSIGGRLRARTVRGKILAILENDATQLPQELTTETGEIEVHVWEDARLHVDLATSGEISTDFSLSIEHRRLEEPSKHGEALVGGGGPRLTLHSKRGRIRLLRMPKQGGAGG